MEKNLHSVENPMDDERFASVCSAVAWDGIVVHFAELALKGGNRGPFLRRLRKNMERVLLPYEVRIHDRADRIEIATTPDNIITVWQVAARVFGTSHIAPYKTLPREIEPLQEAALSLYKATAQPKATFGVRVKRIDKTFALSSQELERAIGHYVGARADARVDLRHADVWLPIRIYKHNARLLGPSVSGPGGLPLGVSGKVLSLFSGGIDSAPAAWLMMRRGCLTDFIHFHVFPDARPVRDTKVPRLLETLLRPQGVKSRLFLVPYHPFQFMFLNKEIAQGLELILFRRHMIRVADAVASQHGHEALVTGDNLAQVASQTLSSLAATEHLAGHPVFRPLLTYDKNEVISLAKQIATFDASIEQYKDCCSIVSKRPDTRPHAQRILSAEHELPIARVVDESVKQTEIWTVGV